MPVLELTPDENDLANRDTYIANASVANNNFGLDAQLTIGTRIVGKSSQTLFRALMRFDLTQLIGAVITDATLTISAFGGSLSFDETFSLHRLTRPDWTELGATWNAYNGANAWTTPGGDFDPTPAQSLTIPTVQNLVFVNLGSLVDDALRLRGGLFDVLIKGTATGGSKYLDCYSASDSTPENRPKLVINYTNPIWCVESDDTPMYAVDIKDEAC
jgi:hypothetical protein